MLLPLAGMVSLAVGRSRERRLADYVRILHGLVTQLDERMREAEAWRELMAADKKAALLESGIVAAVRATSEERRTYYAQLVAGGLVGNVDELEAEYLLGLVAELSDAEVLRLSSFLLKNERNSEFWEKHRALIQSPVVTMGSPRAEVERAAIPENYDQHLIRLGLLNASHRADRNHRVVIRPSGLSPLGRLVLRRIGCAEEDDL